MKRVPYFLSLLLALLCVAPLAAQDTSGTIIGRVIDSATVQPLAGVTILVVGTQRRTSSGEDGAFILRDVPAGLHRLRLSRIGYTPSFREVTVAPGETVTLELTLQPQAALLQAVVVTGYGEQQARDVTGAVQRVGSATFNQGSIVSPDQLVAGKIPGVQITSNTGEPGGQTYIRIRGGTSINASNDPLFVIDGVPVDNVPHSPGAFSAGRNPLNFINPSDIESITVLRDASAAAIYGSRGANGVIIVTTKGAGGRSPGRVTYDTWMSIAHSTGQVPVLGAADFQQAVLAKAAARDTLLGSASTDWQGLIQRDGIGRNHAVSFSGGTENISYRAGIGYLDQEGIIRASGTTRTSLTFNYIHNLLDDRLQLRANLKAAQTSDRFAPGGTVSNAVSFAPTQPVRDSASIWAGYWEWGADLGTKNPIAEYRLMEDVGKSLRGIGNLELEYHVPSISGLSARVNLGFDRSDGERNRFAPNNLRSQYSVNGEIRQASFTRNNRLLDAYLHYVRDLPGASSRLDFTGGYSYQGWDSKYPEFRAWDLSSNLLGSGSTAPAREHSTFLREEANRLISFFGRVNYGLQDKYLATVTVRHDGSSRFGIANRWGTFPSAAVAWRIGEEAFAQSLASVFSDLKLRLGWGVTGNQEIGDFRYLRTFTFGDNAAQYQFGNEFIGTLRPNGVDPNLKWEETKSTNFGIDYALAGGRWSGSLDYYRKLTTDLLVEVTVPAGANLTNIILTNIGSVQNRGLEFAITGLPVSTPSVTWNVGFNIATNANKVLKLTNFNDPAFQGYPVGGISGGVGNNVQILREGYPVNSFFVFHHLRGADGRPLPDGVDHNGDGTINRADIYADLNGDSRVNDLDRRPYHSPNPKVMLGLTSSLRVSKVDMSFTVRGHFGNYVYNNVASNYGNYSRVISDIVPSNMHRSVLETQFIEPQLFSDYYVENASFLRMDNITLGFHVGDLSRVVQNLRVYGTIQNAFVITGYSGLDPEIGNISGSNGIPRVGIDDNIYPRSRTFILGLSFEK
jgi:iron complex outermembrane receptor protein